MPLPDSRYLTPIDIILEFEKSSKWPDDLRAIQKIKLAFFEQLASALMESVSGLKVNVMVGEGIQESEIIDKAYLEIVTSEGWAFSARPRSNASRSHHRWQAKSHAAYRDDERGEAGEGLF